MRFEPARWLARKPVSDGEYVERIRRGVAHFERWRRWEIGFYAALSVAWFAALVTLGWTQFLKRQIQGLPLGVGIGIIVGSLTGLTTIKLAHGLIFALVSSRRTEKLLLRYHDALAALAETREPADAVGNDS